LTGLRAASAVDLGAAREKMDFAPAEPAPQDGGTEAHD
jgi:hypothetical protein